MKRNKSRRSLSSTAASPNGSVPKIRAQYGFGQPVAFNSLSSPQLRSSPLAKVSEETPAVAPSSAKQQNRENGGKMSNAGLERERRANLILDEEDNMPPKVPAKSAATETEVAPTPRNESEFASNRPHDVAHASLPADLPPQKNQPTTTGPHAFEKGSAVTPSLAPTDTSESNALPFGISQTSWELMPPSLRLQIWLSRSIQTSNNSQVHYNDLHIRHISRYITAGIDTNKKIPCPKCGDPCDVTVSPFCTMCGMSLITLFEPTGPVDKSLPPVTDVTDVVAAAVRATSKGEFSSVIYDWTCTEKGQPKSLKKCFCVLDFDSQCLRLYGDESIRESKPLLVNLAFDTTIRHTTSDSSSHWVEMVVHYNKGPVVECKFSCMDADLANEWVRRIHRCATSVVPMSPVRTAVMRVWGDENLRKWYLLLNRSDSEAPVELLKFPNNKRQMPMECSFRADKVAQPVLLPPRSIVRLIEPVYTKGEDFAVVHCPRTRAVGLSLRSNLYQLGLEQSAECISELLQSATQTGSTLVTSPKMPLLESMVSFSEVSKPRTRRSFSEGLGVPTPKLMEVCTVLKASGHELQERAPEAVRIVFISDTHGRHEHLNLPVGDILVHGGDFIEAYPTNTAAKINNKLPPPLTQLNNFLKWLQYQAQIFKHVVLIPGNHDTLVDPMVSVSPAFATTKTTSNDNQWTVTPSMYQRASDMMLPQRRGGELPDNCIYLDGVRRQYAVVPTGVEGKVLRFFGSPICRSRDPTNKSKRNSKGFCWFNRLERRRDIVGSEFVVTSPSRKAPQHSNNRRSSFNQSLGTGGTNVKPQRILKAPPSAKSSAQILAQVAVGRRLTVLEWVHNSFDQLLYAHIEFSLSDGVAPVDSYSDDEFEDLMDGWIDGRCLQCVRDGNIMAVDLADIGQIKTTLAALPGPSDVANMAKTDANELVEVRSGEHVCILKTSSSSHGYFALVRREADWECKGWILCKRLRETTLFSRTRLWNSLPDNEVDVLLTHSPPSGICSDPSNGCKYLSERIGQLIYPPRYHLFGHEHRLQNSFNAGDSLEGAMKGLNLSSVCEIEATIQGESTCSRIFQTVVQGSPMPQRLRRPITFINGSQMVDLPTVNTQRKANKTGRPITFDYDLVDHHVYKRPIETLLLCLTKLNQRKLFERDQRNERSLYTCNRCDSFYYCASHPIHTCEYDYAQKVLEFSLSSRKKVSARMSDSRGNYVCCGWVTKRPTKTASWKIATGKSKDRVLAVVREGVRCMLRYFDEQGNKLNELQLDETCKLSTKVIQKKEYFVVNISGNRFVARVCDVREIPLALQNKPVSEGGLGRVRVIVHSNEQWLRLIQQACRPDQTSHAHSRNQVAPKSAEPIRTTVASLINEYLPKSCGRFLDLSEERATPILSAPQLEHVQVLRGLLRVSENSVETATSAKTVLSRANFLAKSSRLAAAAVAGEVSQSEYQTLRNDNVAQIIAEIQEDENGSPSDFGVYEAGVVAAAVSVLDNCITKQEFKQIYLKAKRRLDEATVRGYISYEQMLAVQAKVQLVLKQTLGVDSVDEFVRIDPDAPVNVKSERKVDSSNDSS